MPGPRLAGRGPEVTDKKQDEIAEEIRRKLDTTGVE
jgi:hypothetical protein